MLGSDRLATPIAEYGADLVLHGHAHAGSFEGAIGQIPVYNVAVHVTGRDFWIFDLEGARGRSAVEVESRAELELPGARAVVEAIGRHRLPLGLHPARVELLAVLLDRGLHLRGRRDAPRFAAAVDVALQLNGCHVRSP